MWGVLNDVPLIAAGGVRCLGVTAVLIFLRATSSPHHTGLPILVGLDEAGAERGARGLPTPHSLSSGGLAPSGPLSPLLRACLELSAQGLATQQGLCGRSSWISPLPRATHLHGVHDDGEGRVIPEEVRVLGVTGGSRGRAGP